ncbi:hypothetical protein D3C76_770590 [compost metagenome]
MRGVFALVEGNRVKFLTTRGGCLPAGMSKLLIADSYPPREAPEGDFEAWVTESNIVFHHPARAICSRRSQLGDSQRIILEIESLTLKTNNQQNQCLLCRYDSCLRTRISWPMAISRYQVPIEARLVRAFLFPLSRSQTARSCLVLNPRCS